MIKKILILVLFTCFVFAEEEVSINAVPTILGKKEKAEVKQIEQKLITDKYDDIVAILGELKDYTIQHFKDEEEFMLSHKFPMFLTHKMMHNDFVEKIESIDLSKVDNEQNLYLKEILNFVGEWLVEHILVEDAKYSIN